MDSMQQTGIASSGPLVKKQRNLGEVTEYLDAHWKVAIDTSLQRMRSLDAALQHPSRHLPAIFIVGTNGKSITSHLTAKLLSYEGLHVGVYQSPHLLLYKERFEVGLKGVSSKLFAELANEVIAATEHIGIVAHTSELLAAIAFLYFKRNNVDVALLEVANFDTTADPITIAEAQVATITRVTAYKADMTEQHIEDLASSMAGFIKPGMHIISGDQSKSILQLLQRITISRKAHWAMPIRKLAHLTYPFEQLYGRCAALAERIALLFIEHCTTRSVGIDSNSLLVRTTGRRGRPTLEKKREQELHPKKTIEQFWKETICELPCRFQLLDKEKPTLLLDTASNIDAFKNVLLGIRLLHYQRPLKGLSLIVGATKDAFHNEEFIKLVRYFFKKTAGQIFICPPGQAIPGKNESISWNIEQVSSDLKSMKVKARACNSFEEAFELAKSTVDERHGLVVVTGSHAIVANYWHLKGIKKFN